ncbi:hypothetical protein H4R19_001493 [Coemansia spiralis]|nr:hypothetical protein H4R19_001493 [Coemansia spiralis]
MLPEHAEVKVELPQARRLLRKLLGKIADLEDIVPGGRGAPSSAVPMRCGSGGGGGMPPAHPFAAALQQQPRRQPRYTYKRRRHSSPGHGSESSDGDEGVSSGCETASSGRDPAHWLTTPRKRSRRRPSGAMAVGLDSGAPESMATRSRSFSSRLETLIVHTGQEPPNKFKAMYLLSHMVSLGETLWMCGSTDQAHGTARVLPLRVLAAFRVGDAMASDSDDFDFDYADELYGAMPPLLVRFAVWQHAVSLCYRRIPAYADTLSEALWQVGAFAQQRWLIEARLADLEQAGGLLRAASVAPLHLRAIDIGVEAQFVTSMLRRAASSSSSSSSSDDCRQALWCQFVPSGIPLLAAGDDSPADTEMGCLLPTRYAKWVARISSPAQSVRVLGVALGQALALLSQPAGSSAPSTAAERAAALEATHRICSILYTKLGCADAAAVGDSHELTRCLQGCLDRLAALTGVGLPAAGHGAPHVPQRAVDADVVTACLLHQTRLALLLMLHCRRLSAPPGTPVGRCVEPLAATTRKLLGWLCTVGQLLATAGPDGNDHSTGRRALVARFNAAMEAATGAPAHTAMTLRARQILEGIVLPLSAAGASPVQLASIAQVIASGLKKPKFARTVLQLTLSRFDAIWARHHECRAWQHDWTELQSVRGAPALATDPADGPQMDAVRMQLQEQLRGLEEQLAKHAAPVHTAEVPEDELGLLLTLVQSRARRR